jgi:carboxypeptidase family protein/TonB-dependent receptor-like protein
MSIRLGNPVRSLWLIIALLAVPTAYALAGASWSGVLRDTVGKPVGDATIRLHSKSGDRDYTATSSANGSFVFTGVAATDYELSVEVSGNTWRAAHSLPVKDGETITASLQVLSQPAELRLLPAAEETSAQASGGERLSSGEVSSLPLNARDFSKLLLLAAGTMTDANGAANFTQQFAVNGQRGSATVFALDGFDTTDPEMGGATFSNFNVDAIQEVQASSGVMPAEFGHGAASYTNVLTKSGTNQIHGSFFEFARNAAFDARNYFDHKSFADERRIPPFVRNEFGFTNGGPYLPRRSAWESIRLRSPAIR